MKVSFEGEHSAALQLSQNTWLCAEVACLGPAVVGNQSIFTSARHHFNSFIPFFSCKGQDPRAKDSEVKSDLPFAKMESRDSCPKLTSPQHFQMEAVFLLKMPQP